MYTAIFLSLILASWVFLGFIPWLAWSVSTRGNAGLGMLPLCLLAAVVAGLAVPLLLRDDEWGLLWSGLAAMLASSGLLVARRVAVQPSNAQRPRSQDGEAAQ